MRHDELIVCWRVQRLYRQRNGDRKHTVSSLRPECCSLLGENLITAVAPKQHRWASADGQNELVRAIRDSINA